MKNNIKQVLIFLLFPLNLFSQDSTFIVNDSVTGKVELEYLDKYWKTVSIEKSYYCRYTYKFNNIPYESLNDEFIKCTLKSSISQDSLKEGKPILLDGDFFWYDHKNRILGEYHYSKGNQVGICKTYFNYRFFYIPQKVRIFEEVNNNKKHPNFPMSYYYKEYKLNGKIKFEGYYRNGDKDCGLYEIDY